MGQTGGSKWTKVKATRAARELAWGVAMCERRAGRAVPLVEGRVGWRVVFYAPARVRVDEANCIGACKPYLDGIVDAGLLAGDHAAVLTLLGADGARRDPKNPRVEMFFEKL
mgnify:CR=1 FL=1